MCAQAEDLYDLVPEETARECERKWQEESRVFAAEGIHVGPRGAEGVVVGAAGAAAGFFDSASRRRNSVSTMPGMLFSGFQPSLSTVRRTFRRPNTRASLQLQR